MTEDNIGMISENMGKVTWERPGFSLQQVLPIPAPFQHKVDHLKYLIKCEDEAYLQKHPEVSAITGLLTEQVLHHRPKSITKFAREIFSNPNIRSIIASRVLRSKTPTKLETLNWVLQPYKFTDWREVPQNDCGIDTDEDSDLSEDEIEKGHGDDGRHQDEQNHKDKVKHKHVRKSILSGRQTAEKDLEKVSSTLKKDLYDSKEFIEPYMLKYFDVFGKIQYKTEIVSETEVSENIFVEEESGIETEIGSKNGIRGSKPLDEIVNEKLRKEVGENENNEKGDEGETG